MEQRSLRKFSIQHRHPHELWVGTKYLHFMLTYVEYLVENSKGYWISPDWYIHHSNRWVRRGHIIMRIPELLSMVKRCTSNFWDRLYLYRTEYGFQHPCQDFCVRARQSSWQTQTWWTDSNGLDFFMHSYKLIDYIKRIWWSSEGLVVSM